MASVGMRLGRYELLEELGEGGMASVFVARDTSLRRDVAIKVMFPHLARRQEGVARFHREARAAAKLDHPHILRVLDVGGGIDGDDEPGEPPYIVLELIRGPSLDEFFRNREPPLAEVVAAIGVDLCEALAVAHDAGIVHRDVKPGNILVAEGGRLVLGDFGVARVAEEDSLVTQTGAMLGTLAFMSPEQAMGEAIDFRSDLYSVGATLYAIATGSLPYSGNAARMVAQIVGGERIPAERRRPEIGRELSRIIEKLMASTSQERPGSAREVADDLREMVMAGGFGDVDELLARYFGGDDAGQGELRQTVISASLRRALELSQAGRSAAALSLADRVLALDTDNAQARALASNLGRRRGQRWVAVLAPMVAAAVLGYVFWGRPSANVSRYADAGSADAGEVALASIDAGGRDVAAPALAIDAAQNIIDAGGRDKIARVRRPEVVHALAMDAGVARADAAPLRPLVVTPKTGTVTLDMGLWCDVFIDDTAHGRAARGKRIEASAGTHRFRCVQPTTGASWERTATVVAGENLTLSGSPLPPAKIQVRLTQGDRAQIGEAIVANGATTTLPAQRYHVQLYQGDRLLRAGFLTIRESCVLRDAPSLSCQPK